MQAPLHTCLVHQIVLIVHLSLPSMLTYYEASCASCLFIAHLLLLLVLLIKPTIYCCRSPVFFPHHPLFHDKTIHKCLCPSSSSLPSLHDFFAQFCCLTGRSGGWRSQKERKRHHVSTYEDMGGLGASALTPPRPTIVPLRETNAYNNSKQQ